MKIYIKLSYFLTGLLFIATITGCAKGSNVENNTLNNEYCGDGVCNNTETNGTCPEDCVNSLCGNGNIDDNEECDGANLNGQSCTTLQYDSGTLNCDSNCKFDIQQCEGCPNSCELSGSYRCNGVNIEYCSIVDNCLSWAVDTDCSNMEQTCDDSGESPVCSDTCTSTCTVENDTQCNGNTIQQCKTIGTECLIWVDGDNCESSNQVCDEGTGQAICAASCTNTCDAIGDVQCSLNIVEECQLGSNTCLGWATSENCETTGMICESGDCICGPSCTIGEFQCSGDNLEICASGGDGCPVFTVQEDCTTGGKICSGHACICDDTCTLNETQCNVNFTQTCSADANGCLNYTDDIDCTLTNKICSTGTCICNDTCTSDQTQCNGNFIQTCTVDTDGCWSFVDDTDCSSSGQVCSASTCITAILDDYTRTTFSGGYGHVTTTSIGTGDDVYWGVTIPFSFKFFNVPYTQAWVSTNGWLSFGTDPGTSEYDNLSLPAGGEPNEAIYPWWDDLKFDNWDCAHSSTSVIYSSIQGTSPNRIMIVDWYQGCTYEDFENGDGLHTFQVRLYETTNVIEFLYDCANWDTPWNATSDSTIGIEDDQLADRWDEVSDNASSCPGSNYRYTPAPH
jgi:hypothetical protein